MERLPIGRDEECYWRREMPTSPGRVLLIQALARLCMLRHSHDLQLVALTFDEEGSIFVVEPTRSQIRRAARRCGEAFAAGEVHTYCREFGGGRPSPLAPCVWELDHFERRFATSALDPSAPFDALVPPTHWIFVDEQELDGFIRSEEEANRKGPATDRRESAEAEKEPVPPDRRPERYVRMPELERTTGLSRATIYRRIEAGRFPRKVPMEGGVSVWRESEVADWLANPR